MRSRQTTEEFNFVHIEEVDRRNCAISCLVDAPE